MTTRIPASTMSAQAAAAHMSRVKADAEFYDSLDYDRTRYSEDIAVAARIFLIAVRNALRSDPIDLEAVSSAAGRAEASKAEGKAAAASPAAASTTPKGGGNADRKEPSSNQADVAGRGTKRPAPAPLGRNASSQKQKKAKRSPSSSNAGLAGAEAAGNSGGSDGSNGRNSTAAGHANSNGGNTSIAPRSDVACKVKEDGKVSWILAKVSRYVSELKKYEVTDADDQRVKKHMVFKKNIRVLPKKPYEFENKQRVLAVYPDTTVFYPATVTGRRGKHIQCLFDDEDDIIYPTKDVDARFVIHPESG